MNFKKVITASKVVYPYFVKGNHSGNLKMISSYNADECIVTDLNTGCSSIISKNAIEASYTVVNDTYELQNKYE